MTKRDWYSIHGEVKKAESMKSHSSGVGSRMEQNKEGKNSCCSLLPFDYIYMHCENKILLNACMAENRMSLFFKIIMNAGIVNSLPKNGHE